MTVSPHYRINMRTTLTLADDIYEAVKALAEGSGRSIGDVVSELARRGLQPQLDTGSVDGLPYFSVPPGAKVIPSSRATELLAEEGAD